MNKLIWKVNIFIIKFKVVDLFSVKKQITINTVVIQIQAIFFALTNLILTNSAINDSNKLFLGLSDQYQMINYHNHQKLQYYWQSHYQNSMNLILQLQIQEWLYLYLLVSLSFLILVAPNKQFLM